jgi:hypothetical protein
MDNETRLALLEQFAEHSERRLNDLEEQHTAIVERLDRHLEQDAQNHLVLVETLSKATTSIDGLTETVRGLAHSAASANEKATRLETIGLTLMKVGSAGAVVIGGAWAAVTFFLK